MQSTAPDRADRPPGGWSLRRRVVLVVVAASLASALLTGLVAVRGLTAANRAQAAATLGLEADTLASLVEGGRQARLARRVRLLEAGVGWSVDLVGPGTSAAANGGGLDEPFTAQDVARAADDVEAVERSVGGTTWLVIARPAGERTVLLARRLATAVRLSADQRRWLILGGLLGLLGGGLAGLAVAAGVTRPLAALASAARRLTAGERGIAVPVGGPPEVAAVGEALDELSVALARSEDRQRRFLLAVSHELRTPLTAVSGYAEALADDALPAAEVRPAAQVILAEAGRLQRRVEDLLGLARLEADDFRLQLAPVDVAAVVQAAAVAAAPRAQAAGVRLDVEVASGLVVTTDGERLRQIVDALADNALRVLEPGCPLVLAARAEPAPGSDPGRPASVRVEVRDGGPGLAPEDLAVAFDRGELAQRYRGSRPVGSGVGLALVGELARRLGGRPVASLAPEGGACFAVVLPVRPSPRPAGIA